MPDQSCEDVDPTEFAALVELSRKMTPGERVARAFELTAAHEALQRESIRSRYPGASEREVFLRVAALRLDRETMIKVYGWDPDLSP